MQVPSATPARPVRSLAVSVIVASALVLAAITATSSVEAADSSVTIWGSAAPSSVALDPDVASVELGTRFTAGDDGIVTAIRFYKSPGVTGKHTATLWSSSGAKLAGVVFASETASGWQAAKLATPVELEAGTTYVVSYRVPEGGRYSSTANYSGSSMTSSLGISANSGVYTYAKPGTVPAASWRSSQYWVDVVYVPDSPPNPTPYATPSATSAPLATPTSTPTAAFEPVPTPTPASEAQAGPLCRGFEKWSDPTSWGSAGVPKANSSVTVPAGASIQVDVTVPHLNSVVVPAKTTLCFPDRPALFSAKQIVVMGHLIAGTASTPLKSEVTIRLEGGVNGKDNYLLTGQAASAIAAYNAAHKNDCTSGTGSCVNIGTGAGTNLLLALDGGVLDLHGQTVGTTWTELATTAKARSSTLALQDPVKWKPGDTIAVASSYQDWNKQEKAVVRSVSSDGKTVTLAAPLANAHAAISTCQTLTGATRCVDERAEVGLLTHNLKIVGPANTAAHDGFGGQTMVAAGGQIHIASAELTNMGQKGVVGRYPIHFHIVGDAGSQSSVENVSLHDNFNRQVTIHGTNNVQVSGTVSYLTYGHSFMFEDGFEVRNVLTKNLVMGSEFNPVASQRVRPSDAVPSDFWMSNPNNDLIGNHAAGGDGNGIWFDFGPDNFNVWQALATRFGTVNDNVAHSHDEVPGLDLASDHESGNGIFVGGYQGQPSTRMAANRNSAWKNSGFGFWIDGLIDFKASTAANNRIGATLQNAAMTGGLFVGTTANTGGDARSEASLAAEGSGLLRPYHGASDFDDIWLAGFGGTDSTKYMSAFSDGGAGISDHPPRIRNIKFFGPGFRVFYEACPFNEGSAKKWGTCYWGLEHGGNSHALVDLDGSIVGDGKPIIITNSSPFMRPTGARFLYPNLVDQPSWGTTSRGLITPPGARYVAFEVREASGPIKMTRDSDGAVNEEGSGNFWTMAKTGERYFLSNVPTFFNLSGNYAGYVDVYMNMPKSPQKVGRGGWDEHGRAAQPKASSLANLGKDGVWWWGSGKLYIRMSIDGSDVPFGKAGDESSLNYHGGMYWSVIP
ncbi:DUF4082 domain-containing protein [Microbacterium deminutum]|uniref:G8 domain-containing protein n=1 Tax=Microbacterium deminutum TaxID=344164 RepID=A0ABN2QKS6_9MICO